MPLSRYGVLVGTLVGHERDRPDAQGRWYHVTLKLDAPAGRYRCAVDVDSKASAIGVQWQVLTLGPQDLGPVDALENGYHDLASTPTSGALDLIRGFPCPTWTAGSHLEASVALESVLDPGATTLVWGEPFRDGGRGMHNIHQNQGDPYGSRWWEENGIWQDGGTMTRRPDGRLHVFVSKFSTQADATDDQGHPVA